jgi:predicted  nucleic acid-binding Zn-ribbon protein
MSPTIEVDIKEVLDKLDRKLDSIKEDVSDLKVGQARLEENGKRLEDKIDNLGKRLDNQEFLSRGVLIGLLVALVGGLAKLFGFVGNP